MSYLRAIKDDIYYVGASDYKINLFENLFPLEHGVSYNAYLIIDEKTCLLDTVDNSVKEEYLASVTSGLKGRTLDYLVVHHLEPDHSAVLLDIIKQYPEATLVLNAKSATMLQNFIGESIEYHSLIVQEKDTLSLGKHTLSFMMAPMVHWPEVMVSYEISEKILFSADAFGTFGALSGNIFNDEMVIDENFYSEARRYYTNIVGKFGAPTQTLLKKASQLEIQMICPLHGPIFKNQFAEFIKRYDLWSRNEPECNDVIIIYGSMYGNTYRACSELALRMADKGLKNIKMYEVSKTDVSYLISEIFRVKNLILACPNYNGGIYPKMHNLLIDMQALGVSNKNIGVIENGSWAPIIGKKIKEILLSLKNINILNSELKITTMLKASNEPAMISLVEEICSLANH